MSNVRPTFAKRNRETSLKDKARIKEERRAAKRQEVRTVKGPEIAWDEAVREIDSDPALGPATNEHSAAPAPKPIAPAAAAPKPIAASPSKPTAALSSKPTAALPSKPTAALPSKPTAALPSKPTAAPAPMATSSPAGRFAAARAPALIRSVVRRHDCGLGRLLLAAEVAIAEHVERRHDEQR